MARLLAYTPHPQQENAVKTIRNAALTTLALTSAACIAVGLTGLVLLCL